MNIKTTSILELDDIQSGVLRPRPSPYAANFIILRIDNYNAGRKLMQKLSTVVTSAASPISSLSDTWVSVALSYQGLKALEVPRDSLESLSWEFRQGMAARWKELGDVGDSNPEKWEKPLGTAETHVVIVAVAPDEQKLDRAREHILKSYEKLSDITTIWRQDCYALPNRKEPFGFRDAISHPSVEGSNIAGTNPLIKPFKAGEFVLGYPDELGDIQRTKPEILGRNGSYVAFRKLHQRVAIFRQYLKANASSPEEEELLAAKMMGRWRSGAPLALCPAQDDPELGSDPKRNNHFLYEKDDSIGLKTPRGSHIRRTNPRDASVAGMARLHQMIRRGTAYGPPLPEGALKDDGADRGLMFAFIGAHLGRQFEFVHSQWINDSTFFGAGSDKDPIAGSGQGNSGFTLPHLPVRKRLQGIPQFVITRGGEYCFMPGLKALKWLANPSG